MQQSNFYNRIKYGADLQDKPLTTPIYPQIVRYHDHHPMLIHRLYCVKSALPRFVTQMVTRISICLLLGVACISASWASTYPTLLDSIDPPLQQALERELDTLSLTSAVENNHLSVTVVDITDPESPRSAEVNGELNMYSASLPKIAILLGAMQKVEDGDLELTPAFEQQLTNMIRNSSNADASSVLDKVGAPYLADLLQSDPYKLYKEGSGGLWVGRPYSRGPVWKRDPINNISHGASSHEVARFYYLLATDRLVSPEYCAVMTEILSEPAINHKFVRGLKEYPDADVMRKSGTWRTYHSDSALVKRDGRQYIVVALANDPQGSKWLEEIAPMADRIVFDTANEQ